MKKSLTLLLSGASAVLFGIGAAACTDSLSVSEAGSGGDSSSGNEPAAVRLDGEYTLNDFESVADLYAFKPVDSALGLRGTFDIVGERKTHGENSLKYTHRAGAEMKMNFYIAQTPYPDMDISTLTKIEFDVFNGGEESVSVKLELSGAGTVLASQTDVFSAGEWGTVTLETALTLTRPNAEAIDLVALTILAPETGEAAYYVDNFRATFDEDVFNVDQMLARLDTIIGSLPAAENITEENRAAINEAVAIYNLFNDDEKARVTQYDKLTACIDKLESLPYVFYDASDPKVVDRFSVVTASGVGLEWTGSISTETDEEGEAWIKFHMDTCGSQGAIYTPYSLNGIDLSSYEYIRFTIRGGAGDTNARFRIITKEWAASVTPWVWYDGRSEEGVEILLYTDQFVNDNYYIVFAGLANYFGCDAYISSFTAYSYKYVQALIDALPDPDTMREEDMQMVMSVYDEFLLLSEESQKKINTERLSACRNAFVKPGDEAEIVAMIDALPDPADVVYTDRTAIQKALNAYNAALEKVRELVGDKYNKLKACYDALDGLPYLIYDAGDPDVVNNLPIMTTSSVGLNWSGTITTVKEGGENRIKFHMNSSESQNSACVVYSLEGVDLSGYEYVHVHVKGGSDGVRFAIIIREWESTVFSVFFNPEGEDIFIPVNLFAAAQENYFRLVIQNFKDGEDVYFSDFTAYNASAVQVMVDSLPEADEMTSKDAALVLKVRALYDHLSEGAQALVDIEKLTALEEALEGGQDEVIALIAALPAPKDMTADDRKAVLEAKAAYDSLTDSAKNLVENADKLNACVAKAEKLPLLIYDAREEDVADKFSVVTTSGVGLEWTGTITTATDEEGAWIKFHADTCGSQGAVYTPYSLYGVDLSGYDYISFKIKGGPDGARFRIITSEWGESVSSWYWYNRDGITEITVPVSQFDSSAYYIVVAGISAGTDIYFGSFYAHGAATVQEMIDSLPEARLVSEEDRAAVEEAKKYYDYLSETAKAEVTADKLTACLEKLELNPPYLFYDASDETVVENFSVVTEAEGGCEWTGTITTVTDDEGAWIKFHVDTCGSQGAVYTPYSLEGIDLEGYDYVSFKIKGGPDGARFRIITSGFSSGVSAWYWYNRDGITEITIPVSQFNSSSWYIIVAGLSAGADIYFGSFYAYSAKTVQKMIDLLPEAAEVTADDRAAIEEAKKYYDYLSETAKAEVTADKLTACIEKLESLDRPYLFYDASDGTVVDHFSVMTEAEGGCEWTGTITTVTDDEGAWIKFHVDTCGSQGAVYTPYSLEGINLEGYDYVSFKIKGGPDGARFRIITSGFSSGVSAWYWYNRDGITEITIPVSQFNSSSWYIIVAGLSAGTDIYIGSFYAHSARTVQKMIDLLPEAAEVTESDRAAIEEAKKYYDCLSEAAKAEVTADKLTACLEKLEELSE